MVKPCRGQREDGSDIDDSCPCEVLLCRHGETDWQRSGKFMGSTNIPLNSTGIEEARQIALAVSSRHPATIWTSPLLRAHDTGTCVATASEAELHVDERLRERALGIMEGSCASQITVDHPNVWKAWSTSYHLPPEANAEAEDAVVSRVEAALFEIAALHPGRTVCVIGHGEMIRCLLMRSVSSASITTLDVGPGPTWRLRKVDDNGHLGIVMPMEERMNEASCWDPRGTDISWGLTSIQSGWNSTSQVCASSSVDQSAEALLPPPEGLA